ncbi:hypothetical protein M0638_16750 [Roseomonas sp. NAR14]|uniref:Uncharacterized protein n=1 Tax=Roseomonas acroporae TaxID=2937791 RepID=A0A9X2BUW4_9PROT|nr:DUF6683 family protein [Roseomonas acroporae]MCK8786028.1 hypothetical protein [Roseomonas acroporae]
MRRQSGKAATLLLALVLAVPPFAGSRAQGKGQNPWPGNAGQGSLGQGSLGQGNPGQGAGPGMAGGNGTPGDMASGNTALGQGVLQFGSPDGFALRIGVRVMQGEGAGGPPGASPAPLAGLPATPPSGWLPPAAPEGQLQGWQPPAGLPGKPPAAGQNALPPPSAAASPAAPLSPQTLRLVSFTPAPQISAQVRAQIQRNIGSSAPQIAEPLRRVLETGAPWQEFDALLLRYGYSPRNLADVMTAYYIVAWEVVNGADASMQTAAIAAARGQFLNVLLSDPGLPGRTDAQKQVTAETLAFLTVFMAALHHQAAQAGPDSANLNAVREMVYQHVRAQGLDLRRVRLTGSGFVPA